MSQVFKIEESSSSHFFNAIGALELEVISVKSNHSWTKNYSWLVYSRVTNQAILIDPSWDTEQLELVIQSQRLSLEGILVTHGHSDHVVSVETIADRHQCPIWIHQQEFKDFDFSWHRKEYVPDVPWDIAGILIEPIATPGHTRGSLCYKIGDCLFTGDTLFIEGCGMCFGGNSDPEELYDSLQLIKRLCQPTTKIFPSHSYGIEPGCTFLTTRKNNIYLCFDNKKDFVTFRMRTHQSGLFAFK